MMKSGLAVAAGLVIGLALIFVLETLGHGLLAVVRMLFGTAPPSSALIVDLVTSSIGIFGGGLVGGLVAGHRALIAWIVGISLFAFAALLLWRLDYPDWVMQGAAVLGLISAALAGQFAARIPNKT